MDLQSWQRRMHGHGQPRIHRTRSHGPAHGAQPDQGRTHRHTLQPQPGGRGRTRGRGRTAGGGPGGGGPERPGALHLPLHARRGREHPAAGAGGRAARRHLRRPLHHRRAGRQAHRRDVRGEGRPVHRRPGLRRPLGRGGRRRSPSCAAATGRPSRRCFPTFRSRASRSTTWGRWVRAPWPSSATTSWWASTRRPWPRPSCWAPRRASIPRRSTRSSPDATGHSAQIARNIPQFVFPGKFDAAFSIDHLHKDVALGGRTGEGRERADGPRGRHAAAAGGGPGAGLRQRRPGRARSVRWRTSPV